MIVDNLDVLNEYNIVPQVVLDFIKNLTVSTPDGRYEITEKIYANIETYEKKGEYEAYLESHRKYIDLQFLLYGDERIDYINVDGLEPRGAYDCEKDIIFYKRPKVEVGSIYLNGRNFAIFFPQDAHAPQITTFALQNNVKKVVVKIAVDFSLWLSVLFLI